MTLNSTRAVAELIFARFETQGFSQVSGYNRFIFNGKKSNSVIVRRENGKDATIPITAIEKGISAVRTDPQVYDDGPNSLRKHGITHINSVIWSLLHLVTVDEICGNFIDPSEAGL